MNTIPRLPRRLVPIRDAAIEHALAGAPLPADLHLLQEWLEGDGWDALVAAWKDDLVAVILAELDLTDEALRWNEGLRPHERITDAMRVRYARSSLERRIEDACFGESVHSYPLRRRDGRSAFLCCTLQLQGQLDPCATWHGVFPSREAFREHLRGAGYWPNDEDHAFEGLVLKLWQRGKTAGWRARRASRPCRTPRNGT